MKIFGFLNLQFFEKLANGQVVSIDSEILRSKSENSVGSIFPLEIDAKNLHRDFFRVYLRMKLIRYFGKGMRRKKWASVVISGNFGRK